MARIQSIYPRTAFKMGFLVLAVFGLMMGLLCSTAAFAGVRVAHHPMLTGAWVLAPLVICPIFWGVLGGIVAVIAAVVYNLAAELFGGLEVDIR